MRILARLAVLILCAVAVAHAAPINVGGKKSPIVTKGSHKFAATVAGSNLDASILQTIVQPSGAATIILHYTNTATGRALMDRTIIVPADRTKPITDTTGVQLSATVPSALGTAIDSFNTQLNSLVSSAAAAGKLDL